VWLLAKLKVEGSNLFRSARWWMDIDSSAGGDPDYATEHGEVEATSGME